MKILLLKHCKRRLQNVVYSFYHCFIQKYDGWQKRLDFQIYEEDADVYPFKNYYVEMWCENNKLTFRLELSVAEKRYVSSRFSPEYYEKQIVNFTETYYGSKLISDFINSIFAQDRATLRSDPSGVCI